MTLFISTSAIVILSSFINFVVSGFGIVIGTIIIIATILAIIGLVTTLVLFIFGLFVKKFNIEYFIGFIMFLLLTVFMIWICCFVGIL